MKKSFLLISLLFTIAGWSQSLDFGVEVQQNNNLVKKWLQTDELNNFNRAFSLEDINGDTLNVYFNTFSMTNNFEIPLYFRYNFKKRFFVDLKLSNTAHTLNMEGVSNYNESFFVSNYGTFSDFESQALLNGFTSVDTSDYLNYINSAKNQYLQPIRSKEEFKVLSFTTNVGFNLLPHRSIKPYFTAGFTAKAKYRKYSYQYLDFSNSNIYDNSKVYDGVNKFSEITYYVNLGIGAQFYRFRAGLYYQAGLSYQAANGVTNDVVIDVNPFTPFERIHSYGFTLSANLFSTPIGKRVIFDDLESEKIILSNVEKKKYKWEFMMRFNRRGFNDVTSFYAAPDNRLSVMTRDSILFNTGSAIKSGEKIEMVTLGDIKKITWTGQFDLVLIRHFSRRFSVEAMIGSSTLVSDIETKELSATVIHDTTGNSWYLGNNEPRINAGVYRTRFNLSNFSLALRYKFIDRDLFEMTVLAGTGFTGMLQVSLSYVDLPDGVNELNIYNELDNNYYSGQNTPLYAHVGSMQPDLNQSPDVFFSNFGNAKLDNTWQTPEKQRAGFPMMRFGFEAAIDRFTIGLVVDRSKSYMDGFILNRYTSVYFSVGYKLWRMER
jgi:hypothetical protein